MRIRWRSAAAAVLVAGMALATSPATANADEDNRVVKLEMPKGTTLLSYIVLDDSGKPVTNVSVTIETTATKQYSVFNIAPETTSLVCELYPSPAPSYSYSNHTLHYGVQAICNQTVGVKVRMALFSGLTRDEIVQWQDSTSWRYGTGAASQGKNPTCVEWGYNIYWKLFGYAEVYSKGAWRQFVPYPGETVTYEACVDIP